MSSISARSARPVTPHRERSLPVSHAGFLAGEVFLGALFLMLTAAVRSHPQALPGEITLERSLQHLLLPHKPLASFIEAISTLNWPVPSAITLAVIVVVFLFLRRWLDALIVVPTAIGSAYTNYRISQYIHRPRPHGHGIHVLSVIKHFYSYPSGHVVYATAIFGLFVFLTYQVRRSVAWPLIWLIRVVVFALIVLMPISRMLEGEHWPTDVLGGLLFGGFWMFLAAHIYSWLRYHLPFLLARDER